MVSLVCSLGVLGWMLHRFYISFQCTNNHDPHQICKETTTIDFVQRRQPLVLSRSCKGLPGREARWNGLANKTAQISAGFVCHKFSSGDKNWKQMWLKISKMVERQIKLHRPPLVSFATQFHKIESNRDANVNDFLKVGMSAKISKVVKRIGK